MLRDELRKEQDKCGRFAETPPGDKTARPATDDVREHPGEHTRLGLRKTSTTHPLPGVFGTIAKVAGQEAAVAVALELGGIEFHMPHNLSRAGGPAHALAELVGREAALTPSAWASPGARPGVTAPLPLRGRGVGRGTEWFPVSDRALCSLSPRWRALLNKDHSALRSRTALLGKSVPGLELTRPSPARGRGTLQAIDFWSTEAVGRPLQRGLVIPLYRFD